MSCEPQTPGVLKTPGVLLAAPIVTPLVARQSLDQPPTLRLRLVGEAEPLESLPWQSQGKRVATASLGSFGSFGSFGNAAVDVSIAGALSTRDGLGDRATRKYRHRPQCHCGGEASAVRG